jgi:anthranilate phosphoribosyltransferase
MKDLTDKIGSGAELAEKDVSAAVRALLDEAVPADEKVEFLSALAKRGETASEISHFVRGFLAQAVDPGLDAGAVDFPLVDVCGTGGDRLDLFNVSTTSMFVVAAGGVGVVKHGNRGITSKSGGADVLEALGVRIDLPPAQFAECVKRHGVGFMLAPQYHPAFKAVVPVRKILGERGQRTIFNLIGPLLNPVQPAFQLVGSFSPDLNRVFAEILARLGRVRGRAVSGDAGAGRWMDEYSTIGVNRVAESRSGRAVEESHLDPADLGFAPPSLDDLKGGDAAANAAVLEAVLGGGLPGAKRELVVLNAGLVLELAGAAATAEEGVARAREAIDSGAALAKLRALQAGA